jgi:hypothetical protein
MTAATLPVANSYAALAPDSSSGRAPRAPRRQRPPEFHRAFDTKTLFYDCFWHQDGSRILLVGPPPYGIDYTHARFIARPSGTRLKARLYSSLSVMLTELTGAPADTTAIDAGIAGVDVSLPVQPNACDVLAGSRLVFSINKNNDLVWIREWAEFHARVHGTDAVILVDNGSTRYTAEDVRATLAAVPGIRHVGVPHWPYSFGPKDPAVMKDDHWGRFLQIGSMSMVLRRYGERAYGLLNCDVDELVGTRSGTSIYDLARQSKGGLVVFRGTWIEASAPGTRHRDYTRRLADPEAARSRQRKWALDPSRLWVRKLSVHPYWHWIEGRALFAKSMPPDALYWHFRGINTNWKQNRTAPPTGKVVEDELLVQRFAALEQGA